MEPNGSNGRIVLKNSFSDHGLNISAPSVNYLLLQIGGRVAAPRLRRQKLPVSVGVVLTSIILQKSMLAKKSGLKIFEFFNRIADNQPFDAVSLTNSWIASRVVRALPVAAMAVSPEVPDHHHGG